MFQSGKELEKVFSTSAAFYKLNVNEEVFLCRSVVEIHRTGFQTDGADALVVLLNPGTCLPLAGTDSVSLLTGGVERLPLLPATPDNTLHQLMRLMERMNWHHLRVINLTDLRTGKFEEYREGQIFMEQYGDVRHTIFSEERRNELVPYMKETSVMIAGWGTKSAIGPAAERAHAILSETGKVYGLDYHKHPLYYHPFPWLKGKCIEWLDAMEEQLTEAMEEV